MQSASNSITDLTNITDSIPNPPQPKLPDLCDFVTSIHLFCFVFCAIVLSRRVHWTAFDVSLLRDLSTNQTLNEDRHWRTNYTILSYDRLLHVLDLFSDNPSYFILEYCRPSCNCFDVFFRNCFATRMSRRYAKRFFAYRQCPHELKTRYQFWKK